MVNHFLRYSSCFFDNQGNKAIALSVVKVSQPLCLILVFPLDSMHPLKVYDEIDNALNDI